MVQMRLGMEFDYQANKQSLLLHIASELNRVFPGMVPRVRKRVGDELYQAVWDSDEAASLLDGKLKGELGVVRSEEAIDEVARTLVENMVVSFSPFYPKGDGFSGGLSVLIMRSDMADLLALPIGKFESKKGFVITWLRWLLTMGDKIVVYDHRFRAGAYIASRTKRGIMRKKGQWRVPPEFSGTAANNWLIRVLRGFGDNVHRILQEELARSV